MPVSQKGQIFEEQKILQIEDYKMDAYRWNRGLRCFAGTFQTDHQWEETGLQLKAGEVETEAVKTGRAFS